MFRLIFPSHSLVINFGRGKTQNVLIAMDDVPEIVHGDQALTVFSSAQGLHLQEQLVRSLDASGPPIKGHFQRHPGN